MRSVAALLLVGFAVANAQLAYPTPYPSPYPAPYPYQPYRFPGRFAPVPPPPPPPPKVQYVSPTPYYPTPAPVYAKSGVPDKDANIVAEAREVSFDGTFQYGYDTDNGISVKSKGFLKNPGAPNEEPIQVIEGSYSYYDREGKPVTISYIADENGYRAFGDAIPTPAEQYVRAYANAPPPSPAK